MLGPYPAIGLLASASLSLARRWVLEKMGRDYGIALNPETEIGFDMEPQTVNELIEP